MRVKQQEVFGKMYEWWWDGTSRSWLAVRRNEAGNQIGDAMSASTEELILIYIGIDAAGKER